MSSEKTRYSDSELEEFRQIIQDKIDKAENLSPRNWVLERIKFKVISINPNQRLRNSETPIGIKRIL